MSKKVKKPETKPQYPSKEIEAFVWGCPLTPSKDNFCGIAVCGECDAARNFTKKLNELNK